MVTRTQHLFEECAENKTPVLIPALVLGETLCGTPVDEQPALYAAILKRFMVVPYDAQATLHNARIWQEQRELIRQLSTFEGARQAIKMDICILSVALARDCSALYTDDERMQKIAERYIPIKTSGDLPVIFETKSFL